MSRVWPKAAVREGTGHGPDATSQSDPPFGTPGIAAAPERPTDKPHRRRNAGSKSPPAIENVRRIEQSSLPHASNRCIFYLTMARSARCRLMLQLDEPEAFFESWLRSPKMFRRRTAIKTIVGMGAAGDISLGRPMFEPSRSLRQDVATDPVESLHRGAIDLLTIPYDGEWEGWPKNQAGNNSSQVRSQPKGARFRVRRTGIITEWHFQIASNQSDGESTKSRYLGISPHPYPASWDYRIEIFSSNPSWKITGSALFSYNFTVYSKDGSNSFSRSIFCFDQAVHCLYLKVKKDDYLLMRLTNLTGDPENNYVSINSTSVYPKNGINWVGPGASPPEASGRFHGDDNLACVFAGTSTNVIARSPQWMIAVRYRDGVEDGDISADSTMSVFGIAIGDSHVVDQTWSAPYWRRASGFIVSAWHSSYTIPAGPLRVAISGMDIGVQTIDIPALLFPVRDGVLQAREVSFSAPVTFSPSTIYRVVLSSPESTVRAGYSTGACRSAGHLGGPINSPPPQQPPPSKYKLIDRHDWSGNARKSSDNGANWSYLGWSERGGANISFSLRLNGNVSNTEGGLA